jgi:hypothetical protein
MVKSAQVAEELIGEQRIKLPTGSNFSSMERSFRQITFQLSGKNGAPGISDMHGNAVRVSESEAGVERMNAMNSLLSL